jgi:hypothetical protein
MHEYDRCCSQDFGGSHYHCAHCGQVSGMQGHYGRKKEGDTRDSRVRCSNQKPDRDGWGFYCPPGHTCVEAPS